MLHKTVKNKLAGVSNVCDQDILFLTGREKNGGSYNQHQIWNAKRFEIFFFVLRGSNRAKFISVETRQISDYYKNLFSKPIFSLFFSESEF